MSVDISSMDRNPKLYKSHVIYTKQVLAVSLLSYQKMTWLALAHLSHLLVSQSSISLGYRTPTTKVNENA